MSMLKGKLLSEKSFYKIRACLKHAPGVKDFGSTYENIKEDAHEYAIRKFTRTWRSITGE